jgi:GNAT superfamily N-acetyltransferase
MPWLPVVRTYDEVDAYFAGGVLEEDGAWVFEEDGRVLGFAVLDAEGLHHLYVAPDAQRRGIGSALFRCARAARPEGFEFWVFRDNAGARRFYEAHGARCLYETDGAANEERTPDARYEWRPPS